MNRYRSISVVDPDAAAVVDEATEEPTDGIVVEETVEASITE